ncbi:MULTISPECIES: glycosyltransferase family 4 protein [Kaistia]|uniref:Glycosyltransferase family 4 protein n=1 Tax=Kaistia nematophila TaxID=2994654 RepID=A0A9X3DZA5_9HYPH|nr:glycosyltransferase family 4 protein [Kaistia nematophila]MBN9024944.1 glycosyltransferase family 4 protein [Hyphomicrobiales bacterium]MCX5568734.1 glycosyltransferase family 4 protein [Kaistia nematophila]
MAERILVVAHNHPDLHPGGTEIFAHDLFRAYQRAGHEALFLGATNRIHRDEKPGTSFQGIGSGADEMLLWAGHFDRFFMSQVDLYGVIPDLEELLREFRPDVVHIHHLLLIGAEFPALVRRVLPEAQIVMTLHDYYLICAHDGLMMRTTGRERCHGASPDRCHGCFPEVAADQFLLRERYLKTLLTTVDRFVSPSAFLRDRFIAWGLDADKIDVISNGQPDGGRVPSLREDGAPRNIFGYFGNLNPWKGGTVLLDAAERLIGSGTDFELRIHGGTPFQADAFKTELDERFARTSSHVVRRGPYRRQDVPSLMAAVDWVVVPSIWWENAPLVIQEAQQQGRPVIVSGIGGMAEMIKHGVNGLTVAPDDPIDLARTLRQAAADPDLWRRLSANAVSPPTVDDVARDYLTLFGALSHANIPA